MEASTAAPPAARDGESELFDGTAFDAPIPKLDGHVADKLVVAVGGSVTLDRLMNDDVEMIDSLLLGRDVDMVVTATVAGKGFTHSVKGADGEEEEVVAYAVKLKVHSLRRTEEAD